MPISRRGTLAQYAGRLHRLHAAKREVIIYDYVDQDEPTLAKMAGKRRAGAAARKRTARRQTTARISNYTPYGSVGAQ
jgi:superfamily II DNA or RNA helicase